MNSQKLLVECSFKFKIYVDYLNFPFISRYGILIKTRFGRTLIVEAIKD